MIKQLIGPSADPYMVLMYLNAEIVPQNCALTLSVAKLCIDVIG